MRPLLLALLTTVLAGCNSAESFSDDIKMKQAFKIYTTGHYSMFECDGVLAGSMDISESKFRLTETVCDLDLLGFSTSPVGPKARLTSCLSDGGSKPNKEVIFEETNTGLKLHGYDEIIHEFKKCSKINIEKTP